MEEITIKDVGDKAVEALQSREKDPKNAKNYVNENSANVDDKAVLDTAAIKDSTLSYKPTPFGNFILISSHIQNLS